MTRQGPTSTVAKGGAIAGRRADIQGLRALAVLMVVLFHAGSPLPGGFVGVDVFFVISGYVITSMLQREFAVHGRIRFGRFYLRRFKRLTPALATVVVFTVAVGTLLLSPLGTQQTAAQTALGAMLLAANLVIARTTGDYFDAPAEGNPLLNTWSLSVEEQFYLVFPLVLALSWAGTRRRHSLVRSPAVVVGTIGLVSFALAVLGSMEPRHPNPYIDAVLSALLGFYSPLTRAWEFAVGALLVLAPGLLRRVPTSWGSPIGLAGAALLAASLWLISGSVPFPGVWTLLPVIGTGLLLLAGSRDERGVTSLLARRPMVAVGDLSYSLYLWHWPLIVFAKLMWPSSSFAAPMAAILSFAPAYLSYRWIEQPIRVMNLPSPRRAVVVVSATVLPPLALSALLYAGATNGFWSPAVTAYQAQVMPLHAAAEAGCHAVGPMGSPSGPDCVWNASSAGAPIYVAGDSNAEHWSEAVIAAGVDLGRPISIKTGGNCPLVDLEIDRLDAVDEVNAACSDYIDGTLNYLISAPPGTVVLSTAENYWTNPKVSVGETDASATTETTRKLDLLSRGLMSTVDRLRQAGHSVVLVQARPTYTGANAWSPAQCSLLAIVSGAGCNAELPVEAAMQQQGAVRQVVAEVAAQSAVTLLDPWTTLCPDGVCGTQAGDLVRYRDASHVSVRQSEAMAPEFTAAIRASLE